MQITKPVLQDYHTFAGIKYTMEEMKDPFKNIKVGTWQIRRLRKIFTNEIKVVSSYNMGANYSHSNIINLDYVGHILGKERVLQYTKGKDCKPWKGTWRVWYVSE